MICLHRHRRFSGIGARFQAHWRGTAAKAFLAACFVGTIAFAPAAGAVTGFTGLFDPDNTENWQLSVALADTSYSPVPPTCDDLAVNLGCVFTEEAQQGTVFIGAQWVSEIAGDNPAVVTWTWTNPTAIGYYVSFNYEIDNTPGAAGFANIYVNGIEYTPSNWDVSDGPGSLDSVLVGSAQSVVFKVTAPINEGASTFLKISGFNGTEVPAPLPATGAASAFAFSRRMRRKIRGESSPTIPQVLPAEPPTAYLASHLNLVPGVLPSLPISFEYGALLQQTGSPVCAGGKSTPAGASRS